MITTLRGHTSRAPSVDADGNGLALKVHEFWGRRLGAAPTQGLSAAPTPPDCCPLPAAQATRAEPLQASPTLTPLAGGASRERAGSSQIVSS